MTLIDNLRWLKTAAHSFSETTDVPKCFALVREGNPYDQMFFGELSDPQWLPALSGAGFFSRLPTPTVTSTGVQYPRHLPLFGLSKVATAAPEKVTLILEGLDLPNNPAICDQVMLVIDAITDASMATRLVPVLRRLIEMPSSSSLLSLDDILVRWLRADALESCGEVISAYFMAEAKNTLEAPARSSEWQIDEIDQKVVAPLGEKQPIEVAERVFVALSAWAKNERLRIAKDPSYSAQDSENDPDDSYPPTYWLEEFGTRNIGGHDLEDTLAQRLYLIGRNILGTGDPLRISRFDALLRQEKWHLFRRLRCQLYADHPALTLAFARQEALQRIPSLHLAIRRHSFEFASMLQAHSRHHGSKFLDAKEVAAFANAVLAGPVTERGEVDENYRDRFRRLQLYPIRALLSGDLLTRFNKLSTATTDVPLESFKPFSSGGGARTIEQVAPALAAEMGRMSDVELWTFLNEWHPSTDASRGHEWWVEEDVGALADKFAQLLQTSPDRFTPESQWWQNLKRPVFLRKPLELATPRLARQQSEKEAPIKPSNAEWRNWFGLARWITAQTPTDDLEGGTEGRDEEPEWNYAKIVVVSFLKAAVRSDVQIPEAFRDEVGLLLRKLIDDPDYTLQKAEKSWMGDWLTTAINSVRGTAVETLLDLGLLQEKREKAIGSRKWIFDLIASRLRRNDESPAIFAILGARLRLAVHLFRDYWKDKTDLLLPPHQHDHRAALVMSHIRYDNPMSAVIEALPGLPTEALRCLEKIPREGNWNDRPHGDFGSRLGTHLGFYYWNDLFKEQAVADQTLAHFFEIASPQSRSATITQIGRIFEKSLPDEEHVELHPRVMKLWDRRFSQIEAALDLKPDSIGGFRDEVGAFLGWLRCECFPLGWRYECVQRALGRLDKVPSVYLFIETLENLSSSNESLEVAIRVLHALMGKASDELRWSYRDDKVKAILKRGFASADPSISQLTLEIQESLLRQGFLTYLEI